MKGKGRVDGNLMTEVSVKGRCFVDKLRLKLVLAYLTWQPLDFKA